MSSRRRWNTGKGRSVNSRFRDWRLGTQLSLTAIEPFREQSHFASQAEFWGVSVSAIFCIWQVDPKNLGLVRGVTRVWSNEPHSHFRSVLKHAHYAVDLFGANKRPCFLFRASGRMSSMISSCRLWPCDGEQERAFFQCFDVVFKAAIKSQEISGDKVLHAIFRKMDSNLSQKHVH
jgi:hypothetical protein